MFSPAQVTQVAAVQAGTPPPPPDGSALDFSNADNAAIGIAVGAY